VRGDQHDVGARRQLADGVQEPCGHALAQRRERDTGTVRPGGEVLGMVGDREHADLEAAGPQQRRPASRRQVAAGPDRGDPGGCQVLDGVAERQPAEVQRMVVGQRDQVDAQLGQARGRHRRGAEVERLARGRPGTPAGGDAALQVADEQVGRAAQLRQLGSDQGRAGRLQQGLGDPAPEHGVPGQRDRDRGH
jgi:hypothetical protein